MHVESASRSGRVRLREELMVDVKVKGKMSFDHLIRNMGIAIKARHIDDGVIEARG